MKVIQQRLVLLTTLSTMVLLVCLILFIKSFVIFMVNMQVFLALLLLEYTILLTLLILEFDRYNTAKLIIENKIIHIQVAKIEQYSIEAGMNALPIDDIEFVISCFGILLGSKVIKFNIEGISLKEVEIGHDFICLTYGTDKEIQIIKLLHSIIGKQELQHIVERFNYETGIIPIVVD